MTGYRLLPNQIVNHALKHFGTLNSLQKHIISWLAETSREKNLVFTKAAVNYILGEIRSPAVLEEISNEKAIDVLQQLLKVSYKYSRRLYKIPRARNRSSSQKLRRGRIGYCLGPRMYSDPRKLFLISESSIHNALRSFKCPKPWC